VSVNYEGHLYSVPGPIDGLPDPDRLRGGVSSQVLSIVREQIALNSSAKSLPQSSVITLVGQ